MAKSIPLRTRISFKKLDFGWFSISIVLLSSYILGELIPLLHVVIPLVRGALDFDIAWALIVLIVLPIHGLMLAFPGTILAFILGLCFRYLIQKTTVSDKILITIIGITFLFMFGAGIYIVSFIYTILNQYH